MDDANIRSTLYRLDCHTANGITQTLLLHLIPYLSFSLEFYPLKPLSYNQIYDEIMRKFMSVASHQDVLKRISDKLSMDIITMISNGVTDSEDIMQMLQITRKQYYSRTSRLLKVGLLSRRNNNMIMLSSFGRLVYHAQLKIAKTLLHSSELRMTDTVISDSRISGYFMPGWFGVSSFPPNQPCLIYFFYVPPRTSLKLSLVISQS